MSELSALAGSERYGACDDEAQRSGSGPKSEEIPCPAQFSPQGGNGAVKGIQSPASPRILGAELSEAGPARKAKKFPVRRSFRREAETER